MFCLCTWFQNLKQAQGEPIRDPFHRAFGSAVQWYDCLKVAVRRSVENTIEEAHTRISSPPDPVSAAEFLDAKRLPPPVLDVPSHYKPSTTEAARLLQKRCPACFGGRVKGRSFKECVSCFSSNSPSSSHVLVVVTSMRQQTVISITGTCPMRGTVCRFIIQTTSYQRNRWML